MSGRANHKKFLVGWQINVANYTFQGFTDEEIAKLVFGTDPENKRAMATAKQKIRRLRKEEKFQNYYRDIITDWSVTHVGKALTTIAKQMDDPNPWIVNKAANDVLTQSKAVITGADDNTMVVRVEGMPELGSPDAE